MPSNQHLIFKSNMRTILLAMALSLLVVGCDGNKKSADASETKDTCSSTTDYETGLKNGLRVAPPCDITNNGTYKDKCVGEYKSTTWTNCFGERSLPNGEKYRGGYLEGKANGKGEFINADGTRYLGYYEKGKRNGAGKEYDANGKVIKVGEWSNGVFNSSAQDQNDQKITSQTNQSTSSEVLTCIFSEFKTPNTGGYQPYNGDATRVEYNESRLLYGGGKMLYLAVNGFIGVPGPDNSTASTYKNDKGYVVTIFKTPSQGVVIAMRSDPYSYTGRCS